MITLRELAEALGVSTATVSNAIKGKGRMNPEKRLKILEFASERGYDIENAQSRQHSKNVSIIVEQFGCFFIDTIIEYFCAAAETANVSVSLHNLNLVTKLQTILPDPGPLKELVRPVFHSVLGSSSGILYLSQYPRDLTDIFPKVSLPMLIDLGSTREAIPCVNYDDAHGAYLATEHLIQAGCKRIAMVSGPINSISMTKRLSGYQRALLDGGLPFNPRLIQLSDWLTDSGYLCAKLLLQQDPRPDGFFCQNDSMAFGAMKAAAEMGLSIPQDIAIVGFDNDRFSAMLSPPLTTIAPPFKELGIKAFECLQAQMNGTFSEGCKLKCTLIARESSLRVGLTTKEISPDESKRQK